MYKLLSKGTVEEGMNRCAENKLKLEEDVTGMGRGNLLQNIFSYQKFLYPSSNSTDLHFAQFGVL